MDLDELKALEKEYEASLCDIYAQDDDDVYDIAGLRGGLHPDEYWFWEQY